VSRQPVRATEPEQLAPEALADVPVRLRAELGRTRLAVSRAVSLEPGAIVDLDRAPDAPVDLFLNGVAFGTARLLVVDGEWAVRIESVFQAAGGPATDS
jgi:flagellar motor switch protein FliN/FliY